MLEPPVKLRMPFCVNFIEWVSNPWPIFQQKIAFVLSYFQGKQSRGNLDIGFMKEDTEARQGARGYRNVTFHRHSLAKEE